MTRETEQLGWFRKGLRTRYNPRWRIGHGLIGSAPWIDAVLLIMLFLFVSSRVVLRTGIVVDLPEAKHTGTTQGGKTAVIVSHEGIDRRERAETVFFDDEPFSVRSSEHMNKLRRRLSESSRAAPDAPLIIEADIDVKYGTIASICNMARDAGFDTVNLAEKIAERKDSD